MSRREQYKKEEREIKAWVLDNNHPITKMKFTNSDAFGVEMFFDNGVKLWICNCSDVFSICTNNYELSLGEMNDIGYDKMKYFSTLNGVKEEILRVIDLNL